MAFVSAFPAPKMSQQKSLNAFFSVRKQAPDHHAAKRRKVVLDDATSSTTTTLTTPTVSKKEFSKIREMPKVVVKTPASVLEGPSGTTDSEVRAARRLRNSLDHRQSMKVNISIAISLAPM